MATEFEAVTFRVVSDNVRLGRGITLPQGNYDGYLEWLTIVLHGHERRSIARAMIPLDRDFLLQLGVQISSGLMSIDCSVLQYVYSGDVIVT